MKSIPFPDRRTPKQKLKDTGRLINWRMVERVERHERGCKIYFASGKWVIDKRTLEELWDSVIQFWK